MKTIKNYNQYIKESLNLNDDYIEEEKYTFNEIRDLEIFYIILFFDNSTYDIGNYVDDYMQDDETFYRLDYHKNDIRILDLLNSELKSYIKYDNSEKIDKIKYHYLKYTLITSATEENKNLIIAINTTNNNNDEIYFSEISINEYLNFLDYALVEDIYLTDNEKIIEFVDYKISTNNNLINDKNFVELLKVCDNLYDKYKYLFNAKNFDIL